MEPICWYQLIDKSQLIVKGQVTALKLVKSRSGSAFVKHTVSVSDFIKLTATPASDIEIESELAIYSGRPTSELRIGDTAYFFINSNFGKWFLSDPDVAAWRLTHEIKMWADAWVIFDLGSTYVLTPERPDVLLDVPEELKRNNNYILRSEILKIAAPHTGAFYTEDALLAYFKAEKCDLSLAQQRRANSLISDSMQHNDRCFSPPNNLTFKPTRQLGQMCEFEAVYEYKIADHSSVQKVVAVADMDAQRIDGAFCFIPYEIIRTRGQDHPMYVRYAQDMWSLE
ncbi:hypothetical protein GCM10008090_33500 [Arenicella chitinivorans]|uniref:Uncharacterized protein n=2 Tax=Arenicella chitinivorans TaxID=1329800 RepID=A0A918VR17_9GAMM|nr:hypothetical protein GCM10008090_33500 [Arenicella chitinivorans]